MGIAFAVMLLLAAAQARPPTLDPTYGMANPKLSRSEATAPADADWIWASTVSDTQVVYCRHSLMFDRPPRRATLFVTADNFFHAFVNGKEVGSTHPDPTDGSVWIKVQKYDVASLLTAGKNEITVQAINAGGAAGLLLRLEVDGRPVLLSDESWHVTDSKQPANWMDVGFDDSKWPRATVEAWIGQGPWGSQMTGWPVALDSAPWYLAHMTVRPNLHRDAKVTGPMWYASGDSVIVEPDDSGKLLTMIFDFGKELTGRVALSADSSFDVKVGTGESAREAIDKPWKSVDMTLGRKPTYTPYTALRYATVTFPAKFNKTIIHMMVDHLYYPVTYLGAFDCSDPQFTKIWYTGAYTAHLCMQDDIWDAPKRDRARWMGDLHISGEVINNVFLDRFLMEQTMDRLRKDAQGGKPATALPDGNVNGIPGYSCAWIAGLADFTRHAGDMNYLRSQRQALITMLEFLKTELGDDGLFANKHKQWPFVDWAPEFNGDTPQARAATHLFLVKAAREAVFLFETLRDSNNAAKYKAWAEELTKVAQKRLVDPSGTFGDRRQENAMAIYSGVATPAQIPAIYREVLRPSSQAWNYVATPYYNNYVLDAITQSGHMQDAMSFVRNYWGGMLAEGATSWWEGYDPSWEKKSFHSHLQADNGTGYFVSLSHGWSAGPTNWLTERVLGVRPTGAGFSTFDLQPNLGDLNWVAGAVPTPRGLIELRIDKIGARYKIQVTVPKGTVGHLGPQVLKPGTQTIEVDAPVDAQ